MSQPNPTPSDVAGESRGADSSSYIPYLIALAVWLTATAPAWISMSIEWWEDPNYSHGLLIVPVSLFFLWRERQRWRSIETGRSLLGLILFAGVALIYLVGTAAAENFSVRVATFAGIGTLAWALLGWRFIRAQWFPFVFLFFAVPWPYIIYYQLTFPLQLFSTKAACAFLNLLGVNFARSGNVIHLPGYSLEVVEACSGVRSLLSLTTLGAAYAYLSQPGYVRPWLLFALSVPIALGANVFRLIITAVGAYAWDPSVAEDFLHEISGIVVFSVALVTLALTGSIMAWLSRIFSRPSP